MISYNNISLFWNLLSFIKIEMRNNENVQELHCASIDPCNTEIKEVTLTLHSRPMLR